jgi:hypothetical protein
MVAHLTFIISQDASGFEFTCINFPPISLK